MAASTKPSYTLSPHQPHTWSLHGKNGMLVSINMDTGETTFGDGYTLDDAVRIFWESVGRKVGPTDELLRRDVAWCEGRDAAAAEFDRTWPEVSAFDLIRELKSPYAERAKDVITRARLLLNQMPAESKARGAAWPSSIPRERESNVLIGAGKKEKEALRRQREARQAAGIKPRGMRPSRIHPRKRPAHEPAVLSDDELREYCREVDATLIGSCKNHELYDWWLDFGPECKELSKTCVSRNS